MSSAPSPTVRRRRLALELRRLREAAKLTCEEVADQLECSASKISRVETGRVSVSPRDVRDLMQIYGVPEDQGDGLVQLARESRQKGWWHGYGDRVQPQLATYLGMESEASEIRHYRVNFIPTVLQTEDYARALLAARPLVDPSPSNEQHLALMMARQRQARINPAKVWVVLDEAALRRQIGGPEAMRQQIEQLRDLSTLPNLFLQVIPFRSGAHAAMATPFVIMSFADPADPDVVWMRYETGSLWIEEPAEVHTYRMFFHHQQAAALSFDDSVNLMNSVLKDL